MTDRTPVLPSDIDWLHGHAVQYAQAQGFGLDVQQSYADWTIEELLAMDDEDRMWELLPTHSVGFRQFADLHPEVWT